VRIVIEVGGWEHECCGASFERESIVEVTVLELAGPDRTSTRYVESHHELGAGREAVAARGRVADIAILHTDGSVESLHRLPAGKALRGFDDEDDGHLEQPWNGQPVVNDSDQFLVTLLT
jgi:hypothetical protein